MYIYKTSFNYYKISANGINIPNIYIIRGMYRFIDALGEVITKKESIKYLNGK